MSPTLDLTPLQPTDDERRRRRDALLAELRAAAPADARPSAGRGTRRAFVRTGLAVSGIAAVGLVGPSVLPGLGGSPVDALAAARAAASPTAGGILHVLVRYEHGSGASLARVGSASPAESASPAGRAEAAVATVGRLTGEMESWTATSPRRERRVWFVDLDDSDAPGRVETSYGPREVRHRDSWDATVRVRPITTAERRRNARDDRRAESGAALGFHVGSDPVAALQRLLETGRLRDAGPADLDGRPVVRLLGREPSGAGGSRTEPVDVEYLVDADTYAPVRITATRVVPARPDAAEPAARRNRQVVQRWTFERFERLPLTPENARLLTVAD